MKHINLKWKYMYKWYSLKGKKIKSKARLEIEEVFPIPEIIWLDG